MNRRKSKSAQSEGLSYEQMAEVIQEHPFMVFLQSGDASVNLYNNYVDTYHPVRLDLREQHSEITRVYSMQSMSPCLVDISNPLWKVIRLKDTPNRYFARLREKWVEL